MAFPGQASGDFTESSSALRIIHVGIRNTFAAQLTTDAFTQTNPPAITGGALHADARSKQLSATPKYGVLSGSVAFTRPDVGSGFIGGPNPEALTATGAVRPLGLFINDAAGNAYENTPGPASGLGPYVHASGTCGSQLFETQNINTGADLTYGMGQFLYASRNGYLTNVSDTDNALEQAAPTILGIVKIAPDSAHGELVLDLRV